MRKRILTLNTETVRILATRELADAHGGMSSAQRTECGSGNCTDVCTGSAKCTQTCGADSNCGCTFD